jgi:hypothetical protein
MGSQPETWFSFIVVGVIFPLHIVAGVTSVPVGLYLLATGSTVAWVSFVAYMPFYLQKAEKRFPGWKGFESIWDFFDYTTTAKSYFGEFEAHGTEKVDVNAQYIVACHPHGKWAYFCDAAALHSAALHCTALHCTALH